MKIKKLHRTHMTLTIQYFLGRYPNMQSEYIKKGFSHKRFQWDCTYQSGLTDFICKKIYPYANDMHIQTVLNQILPKV